MGAPSKTGACAPGLHWAMFRCVRSVACIEGIADHEPFLRVLAQIPCALRCRFRNARDHRAASGRKHRKGAPSLPAAQRCVQSGQSVDRRWPRQSLRNGAMGSRRQLCAGMRRGVQDRARWNGNPLVRLCRRRRRSVSVRGSAQERERRCVWYHVRLLRRVRTVFKLAPDGKETVLHTFRGGNDGFITWSTPVAGQNGNLFGTTEFGANKACLNGLGCGIVFEVTPKGKETALYTFQGSPDGGNPVAGLARDSEGNLYGTTVEGGAACSESEYGCGTVFEVTPSAPKPCSTVSRAAATDIAPKTTC